MTPLEIIRSMSEEQAREISQVIRHYATGDTETAHSIMKGMDTDTLNLLITYIEAVQAERKVAAE